MFDKLLSPSTSKVYDAAISVCHISTNPSSIGNQALVNFLDLVYERSGEATPSRASACPDLGLVVGASALMKPLFEPSVHILQYQSKHLHLLSELHAWRVVL